MISLVLDCITGRKGMRPLPALADNKTLYVHIRSKYPCEVISNPLYPTWSTSQHHVTVKSRLSAGTLAHVTLPGDHSASFYNELQSRCAGRQLLIPWYLESCAKLNIVAVLRGTLMHDIHFLWQLPLHHVSASVNDCRSSNGQPDGRGRWTLKSVSKADSTTNTAWIEASRTFAGPDVIVLFSE